MEVKKVNGERPLDLEEENRALKLALLQETILRLEAEMGSMQLTMLAIQERLPSISHLLAQKRQEWKLQHPETHDGSTSH